MNVNTLNSTDGAGTVLSAGGRVDLSGSQQQGLKHEACFSMSGANPKGESHGWVNADPG